MTLTEQVFKPQITVIEDSRQHQVKVWKQARKSIEAYGITVMRSKLPCGDYAMMKDLSTIVDTKQGFQEVVKNFCSKDRWRVKREVELAQTNGINLIFLIVDEKAETIEDAKRWYNPYGKIKGITLYKTLHTWHEKHGVQFEFCKPWQAGDRILSLLGVDVKELKKQKHDFENQARG